MTQSTWKESATNLVAACVCRNCRQVVSVCRPSVGGFFCAGEDAADRGYADPVAELQQLTLDPPVSPAAVLDREALDDHGDLGLARSGRRQDQRRLAGVAESLKALAGIEATD
jgi:hypothetical protein